MYFCLRRNIFCRVFIVNVMKRRSLRVLILLDIYLILKYFLLLTRWARRATRLCWRRLTTPRSKPNKRRWRCRQLRPTKTDSGGQMLYPPPSQHLTTPKVFKCHCIVSLKHSLVTLHDNSWNLFFPKLFAFCWDISIRFYEFWLAICNA